MGAVSRGRSVGETTCLQRIGQLCVASSAMEDMQVQPQSASRRAGRRNSGGSRAAHNTCSTDTSPISRSESTCRLKRSVLAVAFAMQSNTPRWLHSLDIFSALILALTSATLASCAALASSAAAFFAADFALFSASFRCHAVFPSASIVC